MAAVQREIFCIRSNVRRASKSFLAKKIGGMTHASLSRIERGRQPYSQRILEAIADELTGGDVASLLIRDPTDPNALWSIWERAKPGERAMIVDIAKTIVKTGT
jgi:transcriptional regulator with XRE-family HTH domain